ncbi:SRPBCC family protein [Streptomyces flaveolus]
MKPQIRKCALCARGNGPETCSPALYRQVCSPHPRRWSHLQVDCGTSCEHCSISREIRIEAPPEVVYDVVSRPEHLREWWTDEAGLATSTPVSTGTGAGDHRLDAAASRLMRTAFE